MYWRGIPPIDFPLAASLVSCRPHDIMSAYFLRWIDHGLLTPSTRGTLSRFFNDEIHRLTIEREPEPGSMTAPEQTLWDYLVEAAGPNKILQHNEMSEFFRNNPSEYRDWRVFVLEESTAFLMEQGLLTRTDHQGLFKRYKFEPTAEGQKLADQIHGLKHFLTDFSKITEGETADERLWKDYVVWAAFFGMAEKVVEQFKDVNPKYVDSSTFSAANIRAVNTFT